MSNAFKTCKTKKVVGAMAARSLKLMFVLRKEKASQEVDLKPAFRRLALEILCECALKIELGGDGADSVVRHGTDALQFVRANGWLQSIAFSAFTSYFPALVSLMPRAFLPTSSMDQLLRLTSDILGRTSSDFVAKLEVRSPYAY